MFSNVGYCLVRKTTFIFVTESRMVNSVRRQGNEPTRGSSHVSYVYNDNRMSAVNGMSAMRAQRDDALSVNALLKPAKL